MMRTLLSEDAQKSNALRYGVAAASVAIVSLLTLGLGSLAQFTPFTLFLAAVAFSAWYGGLGPGLFATALSTFAATFIVFPGLVARGLDESDYAVRVFVFLLAALLIDGLSYARTRAEVRIRGERARLQVTLASIGDAVITTGTDGRITYLNPAAEALTGWN